MLQSRRRGPHHCNDIIKVIEGWKWDLIILHPPCDFLTVAGNRWYGEGKQGYHKRVEAVAWTEFLWDTAKQHAKMVALENPIGVMSNTTMGKPTQYIQPWQFGHGETKKTCLWLHNLPPLFPTDIVEGREQRVWKMAPGRNRKRDRSETYQGWADAMAEQWGGESYNDCPYCYGDKVTFHPTYGTESRCTACRGKGKLSVPELRKLDLM